MMTMARRISAIVATIVVLSLLAGMLLQWADAPSWTAYAFGLLACLAATRQVFDVALTFGQTERSTSYGGLEFRIADYHFKFIMARKRSAPETLRLHAELVRRAEAAQRAERGRTGMGPQARDVAVKPTILEVPSEARAEPVSSAWWSFRHRAFAVALVSTLVTGLGALALVKLL
jgi:hypothetical protein